MEACASPDISLGVVLRLSTYVDCQARALGENGFQMLIGGPIVTGLLSGLVTVFVALIGYRLMLGQQPTLRDGIGLTVRLGMVLALVTGWPAFQTLVYRVAVDGPVELAAVLLPATGLSAEGLDARVQQAYDTLRLGGVSGMQPTPSPTPAAGTDRQGQASGSSAIAPALPAGPYAQPSLPQTATIFAASTIGVTSALRIAVGVLLALGPLAILGLLFDTTLGLFSGWIRALAGSALGVIAATMVTALDLMLVEGELGNWQAVERGVTVIDPGGLTTIVLCFIPAMAIGVWAATRMASAFRLSWHGWAQAGDQAPVRATTWITSSSLIPPGDHRPAVTSLPANQGRAQGIADALAATVHRERNAQAQPSGSSMLVSSALSNRDAQAATGSLTTTSSTSSRRTTPRGTRSAARRDRT